MRRCVESLDPYLSEAGFEIDSRHPILDWRLISKDIYKPQLMDPKFASEFNAYLAITGSLFGNNSMAYRLSRDDTPQKNLDDLMDVKRRFREYTSGKLDSAISFLVNLENIGVPQPRKTGIEGTLGVNGTPLDPENFNGRWDYFFFKYIHTPDNLVAYGRENGILEKHGIYDGSISSKQWEQMRDTETLTPQIILENQNE